MAAPPEAYDVEVVEDARSAELRYRDAVRLASGDALLVMTDFIPGAAPSPPTVGAWKQEVRTAAAKGKGPDAILHRLNQLVSDAGVRLPAVCARVAVRERLVTVGWAGAAPPIVVRAVGRIARPQASPSVPLGQVRAAKFSERALQFEAGDTLLVPSAAWVEPLEHMLSQGPDPHLRLVDWIRSQRAPEGASLLCLSMR